MASLRDKTSESFNKFRKRTTISFILIVVALTSILSAIIITVSSKIISTKVSSLIAASSRQIVLNVDTYMNKFITAGTLLFSNDEIYGFDITKDGLDEYEISKSKSVIEGRIYDIAIMENFSDFAIVYSNDKSFGWLSNITQDLFLDGSSKYETFNEYLQSGNDDLGWYYGVKGNTSRVYYLKKLNQNAVLVESFFSRELSQVFEISDQLKGMTVRLIDDSDRIVYSSDKDEIGQQLPANVSEMIGDSRNVSLYNSDMFVNVDSCNNSWRIVCAIPSKVILAENNMLRGSTLIFASILILITIAIIALAQEKLAEPITGVVDGLQKKASYDALSGVLNKASFTENVGIALGSYEVNKGIVNSLIMIDMDNFKKINDTLGHAYGDQVIKRMGSVLMSQFTDHALVGRLGGDEFAIFASYRVSRLSTATDSISNELEKLKKEFAKEFEKEQSDCGVSLSCGVYLTEYSKELSFEEIYKKADKALYVSKKSGKDRYTFYSNEMGV